MLDVCLLGTGGMMPLPNRWLTACLVRYEGSSLLIDCGEGTQITMKMQGWSFKAIDAILFTHFHGDHIGGLPGLLLTIGNAGRTEPVVLMGPKGLRRVVEGLLLIAPELPFSLEYQELTGVDETLMVGDMRIRPFKADHRIQCLGYNVEVDRAPKFQPEQAKALGIPVQYWKVLQKGQAVEVDGITYQPEQVLGEARKGLKLSYCTDSRPKDTIVEAVQGADLFICEGMYGELDKQKNARKYKHMTFQEAASMASKAAVKELWLTHYSPSLVNPNEYIDCARAIFPNTKPGRDRKSVSLLFEETKE